MYALVPDVQRCEPIELAGGCSWTRFRHFGDAEIDAVGKYGREQQDLIPRRLTGLQMSEVRAEPCPAINFLGASR